MLFSLEKPIELIEVNSYVQTLERHARGSGHESNRGRKIYRNVAKRLFKIRSGENDVSSSVLIKLSKLWNVSIDYLLGVSDKREITK